jgi:hypothetical protein
MMCLVGRSGLCVRLLRTGLLILILNPSYPQILMTFMTSLKSGTIEQPFLMAGSLEPTALI